MVFAVDGYGGTDFGPGKDLGDFVGFHIDATVGHGGAEVVVPISTMKAVAHVFGALIVVEKENIGDVGKVVVSAKFFGAAGHFLGADFSPDLKSAGGNGNS